MHQVRLPRVIALLTALIMLAFGCQRATGQPARADGHEATPLKVFILAGQSNMQGHAHERTLGSLAVDPATSPMHDALHNPDGTPRVSEHVWISSLGSAPAETTGRLSTGFGAAGRGPKFGPELAFGFTIERLDEPILIIKTAWGGKSLHTDFRPPSAGPYAFNDEQLKSFNEQGRDVDLLRAEAAAASGHYYALMIEHVRSVLGDIARVYPDYDPSAGYKLAGLVWFQGWNDMVDRGVYPDRGNPGGYDEYSRLLAQFIRDVRTDLETPDLPFVIGVLGVGGPFEHYAADQQRYIPIHRNFREAMAAPAALPEFAGSVVAVSTASCWDLELVGLRDRERALQPEVDAIRVGMKDGNMSDAGGSVAIERLYSKHFSENELVLLRESTSNAEYHYLGSARIMTRIGQAFAEAMIELIDE